MSAAAPIIAALPRIRGRPALHVVALLVDGRQQDGEHDPHEHHDHAEERHDEVGQVALVATISH